MKIAPSLIRSIDACDINARLFQTARGFHAAIELDDEQVWLTPFHPTEAELIAELEFIFSGSTIAIERRYEVVA